MTRWPKVRHLIVRNIEPLNVPYRNFALPLGLISTPAFRRARPTVSPATPKCFPIAFNDLPVWFISVAA